MNKFKKTLKNEWYMLNLLLYTHFSFGLLFIVKLLLNPTIEFYPPIMSFSYFCIRMFFQSEQNLYLLFIAFFLILCEILSLVLITFKKNKSGRILISIIWMLDIVFKVISFFQVDDFHLKFFLLGGSILEIVTLYVFIFKSRNIFDSFKGTKNI